LPIHHFLAACAISCAERFDGHRSLPHRIEGGVGSAIWLPRPDRDLLLDSRFPVSRVGMVAQELRAGGTFSCKLLEEISQ